jgi:hypothetical protein
VDVRACCARALIELSTESNGLAEDPGARVFAAVSSELAIRDAEFPEFGALRFPVALAVGEVLALAA